MKRMLIATVLLLAVGVAAFAATGSFDPNGKPPTKGFVAVLAYKWIRDNAPDAIADCDKTTDQFSDLGGSDISKFKREAINCLASVGFFDNYPGIASVTDSSTTTTPTNSTSVGGEAPRVEPRAGTTTELLALFEDVVRVGETRAYDFAIRTKAPQGRWIEACSTFANTSGQAGTATFRQGFHGLEAGTAYEIRYRYRNSSQCGGGSPSEWSPIGQGTTADDEPSRPSSAFGVGDTIPGFPSGFGALSGTFRNGVQISASGGVVTVTMSNGGTAEYSHATYTCTSAAGCVIENGRVTRGTVTVSDAL